MNVQWLDDLKIAIIDEDIKSIDELCLSMPHFNDLKETASANALIKEALKIIQESQDETGKILTTIKKQKSFLENIGDSTKIDLSS